MRSQRMNLCLLNLKIAHDVLNGLATKPGASANKNGGPLDSSLKEPRIPQDLQYTIGHPALNAAQTVASRDINRSHPGTWLGIARVAWSHHEADWPMMAIVNLDSNQEMKDLATHSRRGQLR